MAVNAPRIAFIDSDDLLSYLPDPDLTVEQAEFWVDLTNQLLSDEWTNPVSPIPARFKSLALEVAGRAIRNRKGLTSWTVSVDDASRTERVSEKGLRVGVFLTAAERALLNGRRPRRSRFGTIRLRVG